MRKAAIIVENRPLKNLFEIIEAHMIHLKGWDCILYDDEKINSPEDYNRLLTNPKFWDIEYDKVLIFQHDSLLLRDGIDEFLQYDFIGAPLYHIKYPAMNGGLSLRTPSAMLKCIEQSPYKGGMNEDIYFSYLCQKLGFKLPPIEVAKKFSVETIFGLGSLGAHAINKWLTIEQQYKILHQYD